MLDMGITASTPGTILTIVLRAGDETGHSTPVHTIPKAVAMEDVRKTAERTG